ncbi:hypothetical protein HGRIS_010181 [Hohenbuehelia grisea]
MDQFRGIFRLTYSGDAHIVLKTKVQANPLNHKQPDVDCIAGSRGMLAAKQALVVPMLLRLSHFKLNSYVVLVVSKQKGITLVFKTDPLQNVDINSTFDSISVIQKFIQREIEGQLRQMFREDLPGIIHRLSQQWVKAKVETPYLSKQPPPPPSSRPPIDVRSAPDLSAPHFNNLSVPPHPHSIRLYPASPSFSPLNPNFIRSPPLTPGSARPARSVSGSSIASTSRRPGGPKPPPPPIADPSSSSHPDLEHFDPTYGLRPEGLPTKSLFHGFGSLFTPNRGLADLTEEASDVGDFEDELDSFDVVDWNTMPTEPPESVMADEDSRTEYETIPAVGGGTITRPRVFHSQSRVQSPDGLSPGVPLFSTRSASFVRVMPSRSSTLPLSGLATPAPYPLRSASYSYFSPEFASLRRHPTGSPVLSSLQPPNSAPPGRSYSGSMLSRPMSPDSLETQPSRSSSGPAHSADTPPSSDPAYAEDMSPPGGSVSPLYMRRSNHSRRPSVSSSAHESSFEFPSDHAERPAIVLRPQLNNSIHQLSTLSHSNHTLSPYTRSMSHFTVRSVPPRGAGGSGVQAAGDRQPVKARRKRTHRLGGKKAPPQEDELGRQDVEDDVPSRRASASPTPPSEFDAEDMDRYFRAHEEFVPRTPEMHPTHVRRRRPSERV